MGLINIRFTKSGVANIGRRELQAVGREAIGAAALLWWQRYLPLHFKNTAYFRYQYKHRNKKYRKAKMRGAKAPDGTPSIKQDLPLVFTGRSRESATRSQHIEKKAKNYKSYTATVIMPAPNLNYIPKLREELTMLIPSEIRMMEREFAAEYERQLNKRGRTNKTTKIYRAAA